MGHRTSIGGIVFCFECGFKLIEGSKFCSSCGTGQITANQTFEVSVTVFSESWIQDADHSEDEGSDAQDVAAETVFLELSPNARATGDFCYLTFAEGVGHTLEDTPFVGTKVDASSTGPEIGFGSSDIDIVSSTLEDDVWSFVVRYVVELKLQVAASSESAAREICENQIKESFAIYGAAAGEISPIEELRISKILDEAAVAKRKETFGY